MSKTKRCRCVLKHPGNGTCPSTSGNGTCVDVCTTPSCEDPSTLTLMAPVIYDQLGINLCSPVSIPGLCDYPSAVSASVQVIDICLGEGSEIEQISGRTNCYQITLANLKVTFAVRVYDCANRLLATLDACETYLPCKSACNYDEETNPSSIEFDIFAPYGVSFDHGKTCSPLLNYIGFSSRNAGLLQGLNYTSFAKILNLDVEESTATVGLTLYVLSLYYAQYQFTGASRADIPKVSLIPDEDTLCQDFVEGDLLNLAIKPLELGAPLCEGCLKKPCPTCDSCCSALTQAEAASSVQSTEDTEE